MNLVRYDAHRPDLRGERNLAAEVLPEFLFHHRLARLWERLYTDFAWRGAVPAWQDRRMSDEGGDPFDFAHGQLTYLQLPAADLYRSAAFYSSVFGWQTESPGSSFEAPGVFGQWVEDRAPAPDAGPLLWLHVDDIDVTLELVSAHGGEVLEPPAPDGPTRMLATVFDPGGNRIGLAQHRPG